MNKFLMTAGITIGFFVVQELGSYILNLCFGKVEKKFPSILGVIKAKKIQKFYEVKNTNEYKKFEYDYLEKYYGKEFFTSTHYGLIPIYSVKYDSSKDKKVDAIKYYDKLAEKTGVDFSFSIEEHKSYKKNRYYRQYKSIVGRNIKAPNRPGFMLDRIFCNEKDEMTGFKGYVGTYAENVYSNHVLEYEMYKLFSLYKKRGQITDKLFEKSVVRNSMHSSVDRESFKNMNSEQMKESLRTGEGRKSLLSVQMLVLMKTEEGYSISIIQRSKNVAVAPGIFQLVPSGGFEILNDSINGYSKYEIEANYSPGIAIFREFIEEIFGEPEFEGDGKGSVNEILLKDTHVYRIEEMLKSDNAKLEFLGSVMDLAGLRQELSFVLIINDKEYVKQKFYGNDEGVNRTFIPGVTAENFESRDDIWKNLHRPSAAMWNLFKKSKVFKEVFGDTINEDSI